MSNMLRKSGDSAIHYVTEYCTETITVSVYATLMFAKDKTIYKHIMFIYPQQM